MSNKNHDCRMRGHKPSVSGRQIRLTGFNFRPPLRSLAAGCLFALAIAGSRAGAEDKNPVWSIGILQDDLPGAPIDRASALHTRLRDEGFNATRLSTEEWISMEAVNEEHFDCLILPDSPRISARLVDPLLAFVERGGDLVLMGGHAFQAGFKRLDDQWIPVEEAEGKLALKDDAPPLFSNHDMSAEDWANDRGTRDGESYISVVPGENGPRMHIHIEGFRNYDTFKVPLPRKPDQGTSSLCLRIRGASRETRHLAVEIEETDKTRWIAVVDLSKEWQTVCLSPDAFEQHDSGEVPVDLGRRVNFLQASKLGLGLAIGYTEQTGETHDIWVEGIRFSGLDVGSINKLRHLNLFTDLPPFQYEAVGLLIVPSEAEPWIGRRTVKGSFDGTAAFAVPRAGQSQLYPLLETAGGVYPLKAASIMAHYGGRYRGSQWLLFGVGTPGFYNGETFSDMLVEALKLMQSGALIEKARAENPLAGDVAKLIGVTHAGGSYNLTGKDYLNEGADVIAELGTRTIKLWLPDPATTYSFNSEWPDVTSMVELLETDYFRRALNGPFDVIYLEAFVAGTNRPFIRDGMSERETAVTENAFFKVTEYLLNTYAGTDKTFVLQNWEGDWALRPAMDRELTPEDIAIQGMIDWMNARQAGVDRARNKSDAEGVAVYHALEMNLVEGAMKDGRPSVVNRVLPHTRVDLASYSNYEIRGNPRNYRAALEFMEMNLPPTTAVKGTRVVVGELGVPEIEMGLANVKHLVPESIEIGAAFGCPQLLYWELYCNEPYRTPVYSNDDVRGFWLIKPDGSKSWAWSYLKSLLVP